jgi:hypothetical protein
MKTKTLTRGRHLEKESIELTDRSDLMAECYAISHEIDVILHP